MLQTLNPYNSTARTAEIMARYTPIAPRPLTSNGGSDQCDSAGSGSGSMSPTIRKSPYLRNVWPHLQSRPTRTRKRGRTSMGPVAGAGAGAGAPSFKRPRSLLQGLSPPFHVTTSRSSNSTTLVTLPLLPCSSISHMQPNKVVPEEKDLLAQLQNRKPKPTTVVISPTPIRLITSTVSIRAIKESSTSIISLLKKSTEEIERELESQVFPAFVSDSNNQVRLVNSAYKQMVGQPDCSWLSMLTPHDGLRLACNIISGQVLLKFIDFPQEDSLLIVSSPGAGFSCLARIEWGNNNFVNAFVEAISLSAYDQSKHYKFAWRFHTTIEATTTTTV